MSQFDSEDVDLEVDANIDEMNLFTEEEQADVMIEDDAAREMECYEDNVVTSTASVVDTIVEGLDSGA